MTRKRKNPVEATEEAAARPFPAKNHSPKKDYANQNEFSQYGYKDENHGQYPAKRPFDRYKNQEAQQDSYEYDANSTNMSGGDAASGFPKDVVTYLRNMERISKDGGFINDAVDRAIDEVTGLEERLLMYPESSRVVEELFGKTSYAAYSFLQLVSKLKHKTIISMIYSGCGAKVLDVLLYRLNLAENAEALQIFELFTELVAENWTDFAHSMNSSFIIRALLRIFSGLQPEANKGDHKKPPAPVTTPKPKYSSPEAEKKLAPFYKKLATLLFDYGSHSAILDHNHIALLIQEGIACEAAHSRVKLIDQFIDAAITKAGDDQTQITKEWEGRNSSRVWEKLVDSCSEDAKLRVWMTISGSASKLAQHQSANFALQKLIRSVRSLELATDIMDELSPILDQLLTSASFGVVQSLVHCASHHDDLQQTLLKSFRRYFKANTESTKLHFLPNVLTMNGSKNQSSEVVPDTITTRGSLVFECLLNLTRTKTISECLKSLSPDTVFQLGTHRVGSHVIEHVFQSKNIGKDVKLQIAGAFEGKWSSLIDNPYGSHVFERLWDCDAFTIDLKERFMHQIMRNTPKGYGKFWRFMLLRTKAELYKKDVKAWVKEWKTEGEMTQKDEKRMNKIKKKAEKKLQANKQSAEAQEPAAEE
ncbi:unnamed protein product, partial [Mesorhabditis spiculigera]